MSHRVPPVILFVLQLLALVVQRFQEPVGHVAPLGALNTPGFENPVE